MNMAKEYARIMYERCKANNIDIKGNFFSTNGGEYSDYQREVAKTVLGGIANEDSIAELIEDGDCAFADYFVDGEYGVNAEDGCGEWLPQYKY